MAQKIVPQKNKLSDLDFKKVIISLDDASGILGIQIKNKHNFIILVLSITIAIDCAVTIYGDFFVSPYNEELLLQLGNMAYFILNEKRQYLVSTINCHRINGIFLLFNHLFMDDYTWMDEANDLFYQIHPQIVIRERFYTTMKNLKIACYLNQVFFALFQNTTYILTYILVYPERLFIPSCIVYNYVTQVYSFIQIRFILQFYIICDMCTDIVRQANEQIVNALESSNLEKIHQSLTTFGIVCQIVNRLNHHLKRIYIIYLTCSLAIIVPLLHAILYTGSTWIILLSLIALLTYYIFLIGYLSHIAGKVDQMAYDSGNKLYQMMISEQSLNLNQKLSLKFKVQQYCDQTLANVIGLSFLGNAINTQTCIKLITTFLTMLALLMSRYKKIDYYM